MCPSPPPPRVLYCCLSLSCLLIGSSSTYGLGGFLRHVKARSHASDPTAQVIPPTCVSDPASPQPRRLPLQLLRLRLRLRLRH